MTSRALIFAPHPIYKTLCPKITELTDQHRALLDDLLATLYSEHGVGIAAPMIGESQPLVVIDLQENGIKSPLFMVNPEIISSSAETQTIEEASLSFLGISAPVTRPQTITVRYMDYEGKTQELTAEGFLATCIQHEVDYLNGLTFLDHLSPVKRDMLVRKMVKNKKHYRPHVHGAHCHHD